MSEGLYVMLRISQEQKVLADSGNHNLRNEINGKEGATYANHKKISRQRGIKKEL